MDAMSNEGMTPSKKSRSVHGTASARLGHGVPQCRTGYDDSRGVGFSVRHERLGEQSGDDGAEDQSVRQFLKIGIVIRQAEEGPVRTHLIMNSHR